MVMCAAMQELAYCGDLDTVLVKKRERAQRIARFRDPAHPFDPQLRDIADPHVRHPILRVPTNSTTRDDSRSSPIPALTIRNTTAVHPAAAPRLRRHAEPGPYPR